MIRSSEEFRKKATMYKRWKACYLKYCKMIEDVEYEESKIPSMFPETIRKKRGRNEDGTPKYVTIAVPPAHGDPKQKTLKRLEMIEYKHELEEVRDDYKTKCDEVDKALARLPKTLRRVAVTIYINRESIEDVAQRLGYTKTGLQKKIDTLLERYLSTP